jgi:hypothetical protein
MLAVNSTISRALGGLPSHFGKCDNGFIWVVLYECLRSVLHFFGDLGFFFFIWVMCYRGLVVFSSYAGTWGVCRSCP